MKYWLVKYTTGKIITVATHMNTTRPRTTCSDVGKDTVWVDLIKISFDKISK